jgi:hypothetical protein
MSISDASSESARNEPENITDPHRLVTADRFMSASPKLSESQPASTYKAPPVTVSMWLSVATDSEPLLAIPSESTAAEPPQTTVVRLLAISEFNLVFAVTSEPLQVTLTKQLSLISPEL